MPLAVLFSVMSYLWSNTGDTVQYVRKGGLLTKRFQCASPKEGTQVGSSRRSPSSAGSTWRKRRPLRGPPSAAGHTASFQLTPPETVDRTEPLTADTDSRSRIQQQQGGASILHMRSTDNTGNLIHFTKVKASICFTQTWIYRIYKF